MKDKRHFLIVGAGLSGLVLAIQLLRKGAHVTLVDNGVNHSSAVAAGLITPLVFRRMTKSWRADDFVPYLHQFYPELEREVGAAFFQPLIIRRLFSSEHERELWIKKQQREDFHDYMHVISPEDENYSEAINEFGSGRLKQGAAVNATTFLSSVKAHIAKHGTVLTESMNYAQLEGTVYNNVIYDDVIFCEGYLGKNNPWFGDLPLHQTKGETLVVQSDGIPEDESVNRKCFILPMGNHRFKVGSTYGWHTATTNITEEGREEILEKVRALTSAKIEVLEQDAGVRPTSIDRRPLIGTHPDHAHYHFFNGMGTKGYLIAPTMSKEFVEHLLEGAPLDPEVDLRRFAEKDK